MEGIFSNYCEIKILDLSNFETPNVINMTLMFNRCYKLKEIKGLNKFKTNKVTTMTGMFAFC